MRKDCPIAEENPRRRSGGERGIRTQMLQQSNSIKDRGGERGGGGGKIISEKD